MREQRIRLTDCLHVGRYLVVGRQANNVSGPFIHIEAGPNGFSVSRYRGRYESTK